MDGPLNKAWEDAHGNAPVCPIEDEITICNGTLNPSNRTGCSNNGVPYTCSITELEIECHNLADTWTRNVGPINCT